MFQYRSTFIGSGRIAGVLGLVLALGGCATAPTPERPQWVAMTPLAPAAVDPAAPWFPRAASLMLRNELALFPGLMVVVPPATPGGTAEVPDAVG